MDIYFVILTVHIIYPNYTEYYSVDKVVESNDTQLDKLYEEYGNYVYNQNLKGVNKRIMIFTRSDMKFLQQEKPGE